MNHGRPAHHHRNTDAALPDGSLVAAQIPVCAQLGDPIIIRPAVVRLENHQRIGRHRIVGIAIPVWIFKHIEDVPEVRVDTGHHRRPPLSL